MPRTADKARYEYETARLLAVVDVLDRTKGQNHQHVAEAVLDALKAVELVLPDDCDHVDAKGESDCIREYGHEPYVEESKLVNGEMKTVRNDEHDGHYTTEYEDNRRPDGTHPWDF